MDARKITASAVLTALALALSYIERFIPLNLAVPLPGVRLGLANVVTLAALYLLGSGYAAVILLLRCLLAALFGGGAAGLLFSLCGGFLAILVMAAVKRTAFFSVFGVSVLGAAAHQAGQILAGILLMRSGYLVGYLPFLLLVSAVTGLLTGLMAAGVLRAVPAILKREVEQS